MNLNKTIQFRARAIRFIKWIDYYLFKLREAEGALDLEAVQRETFVLLALLGSLSDSVRVSMRRFELSVDNFDKLKKKDQLLRYINFARNSEVHADVVKLKKEGFSGKIEVVNPEFLEKMTGGKGEIHAKQAVLRALGRETSGKISTHIETGDTLIDNGILAQSGLELSDVAELFMFIDFEYNYRGVREIIPAPTEHRDKPLPPIVSECIAVARNYFHSQLIGLEQEMKKRPDIVTIES